MQQQHLQHQPKNPHSDDSRRNQAGGNPDKDPKPNPNKDKPQHDKPQPDKPQPDKPQPDKPQPDKPQPDKPRRDDDPRNPTRQRQAFKSY
jgi:hypothetical protein